MTDESESLAENWQPNPFSAIKFQNKSLQNFAKFSIFTGFFFKKKVEIRSNFRPSQICSCQSRFDADKIIFIPSVKLEISYHASKLIHVIDAETSAYEPQKMTSTYEKRHKKKLSSWPT